MALAKTIWPHWHPILHLGGDFPDTNTLRSLLIHGDKIHEDEEKSGTTIIKTLVDHLVKAFDCEQDSSNTTTTALSSFTIANSLVKLLQSGVGDFLRDKYFANFSRDQERMEEPGVTPLMLSHRRARSPQRIGRWDRHHILERSLAHECVPWDMRLLAPLYRHDPGQRLKPAKDGWSRR